MSTRLTMLVALAAATALRCSADPPTLGAADDDPGSPEADAASDSGTPDVTDGDGDADGGAAADAPDAEVDASAPPDAESEPGDSTGDAGGEPDGAPDAEEDAALTVAACFADAFVRESPIVLDYDQFGPVVGSHCLGTNHQAIEGIERVVFLGDSITVGTPPTLSGDYYRVRLAERLADHFGLEAPDQLWKSVNAFSGETIVRESGDFASCARWGARTDDLMRDGSQVGDCFSEADLQRRTLIVMTMGGNDIASITQAGLDGEPLEGIWDEAREFVGLLREAVEWIVAPGRFPNGVFVVFANMFEFTDGTGDTDACPAAALAGFGGEWDDPDALAELVIWANEQYLSIAVDTGTDMIFMLEHFCGHGFNHDDPDGPCYRGPDAENWFDLTCIHPNPTGHGEISRMFMAVVEE